MKQINLQGKMPKTQGVYLITNELNGEKYVGISNDIRARWSAHRQAAINPSYTEYNTPLHQAIRKYGKENFSLSILEEVSDRNQLGEREKYWVNFYDTYNNGYNQTPGGEHVEGEDHHHAALTNKDVEEIRTRWAACKETTLEIAKDYPQITTRSIYHITNWERYPNILPELNTPERRVWHKTQGNKRGAALRKENSKGTKWKEITPEIVRQELRRLKEEGKWPLK